jgi:hypothetical protein
MEIPPAISGYYKTSSPNEDIILPTDKAQIVTNSEKLEGNTTTTIKLLPQPQIMFSVNDLDIIPMEYANIFLEDKTPEIVFPNKKASANIIITTIETTTITSILSRGSIEKEPNDNLSSVIFHILNFENYWGSPIKYVVDNEEVIKRGRIYLITGSTKYFTEQHS